jgi:hypothetical protein
MENEINNLIFTPVVSYMSHGDSIQLCETKYKGVKITQRTFFPYNIFKEPSDIFILDYILPLTQKVVNGEMSSNYYTEDGYGLPVFNKLEDSLNFINEIIK